MAEKTTLDTAKILTHGILARNGVSGRSNSLDGSLDADLIKNHVGVELTNAYITSMFLSDEGRQWRDSNESNSIGGINARLATIPVLTKQVADLTAENKKLKDALAAKPVGNPNDTKAMDAIAVALKDRV